MLSEISQTQDRHCDPTDGESDRDRADGGAGAGPGEGRGGSLRNGDRGSVGQEMAGCTPPGAPLCPEACRPRPLAPMLSLPGCPWLRKANVLTQLPDFLFLGGGRPWVLLTFCVSFTMINSSV